MPMRNTFQLTALRLFTVICASLLVSACQFFDGNGDDSKLTGQAIKGVISNAIIKVYTSQGNKLIAESRSNEAGKYSLDLTTADENSRTQR